MIEKDRNDFLRMLIENKLPSGRWTAVVLLLPTQNLHERQLTAEKTDEIINFGSKMLKTIGDGIYARIGWSSYFAITKNDEYQVTQIIKQEIQKAPINVEDNCMWKYSIEVITKNPFDLFTDMELRTHEK